MNEVMNAILTRRSIRDFTAKEVKKEDVELLIKMGLNAPSGMGRSTWKFTAIMNQEMIKELAQTIEQLQGREGYNFYNANVLILTSNERDSKWGRDDNACAMQNIALAAHSIGIGSVWINQLMDQSDNPSIRKLLNKLQVPNEHVVYGVTALGYSASEPKGNLDKKGEYIIFE